MPNVFFGHVVGYSQKTAGLQLYCRPFREAIGGDAAMGQKRTCLASEACLLLAPGTGPPGSSAITSAKRHERLRTSVRSELAERGSLFLHGPAANSPGRDDDQNLLNDHLVSGDGVAGDRPRIVVPPLPGWNLTGSRLSALRCHRSKPRS